MALRYLPSPGAVLRCDFSGFKPPEMVKPRPVVVISTRPERTNKRTCIVVALSTSAPEPVERHHECIALPGEHLPKDLQRDCWVKGDMVYSVALDRLDLYRLEKETSGKRVYYQTRFDKLALYTIRKRVGHAIGLHEK